MSLSVLLWRSQLSKIFILISGNVKPHLPLLPMRCIGPPPLARLAMSCPACSWTTRPTHVPGPLGSMSSYRYICCSTASYAAWPLIEPLIDWRTHTINNKPSPFD